MTCFLLCLFLIVPSTSLAKMTRMSDQEMAGITGQGTTNLYIEDNTVRLFLDVHMETYGTIDSVKAGYYEKSDLTTLKNHLDGSQEISDTFSYIKDETGTIVVQGFQGTSQNTNTRDWDLNWTGVTMGESNDNPLIVDGLVYRVEFDDINASSKKIKRIIIGTNNMTGVISGDFKKTTGAVNPGAIVDNTNTLAAMGNTPLVMNRDSILQNWSTLSVDGGFFLELNLDNSSPEKGMRTIIGYQESAAVTMTFAGTDWWDE